MRVKYGKSYALGDLAGSRKVSRGRSDGILLAARRSADIVDFVGGRTSVAGRRLHHPPTGRQRSVPFLVSELGRALRQELGGSDARVHRSFPPLGRADRAQECEIVDQPHDPKLVRDDDEPTHSLGHEQLRSGEHRRTFANGGELACKRFRARRVDVSAGEPRHEVFDARSTDVLGKERADVAIALVDDGD